MGPLRIPDATDPLGQGDVLHVEQLYETDADGDAPVAVLGVTHVLVLSRHCNAARKTSIVVAAIKESTPEQLRGLKEMSLDETRRTLAALRDGDGTPDRFYLGSLPASASGRAFAHLDRLYSVQLPAKANGRAAWVASRRIATLSDEHRRHLHVRILTAFGREGFDDVASWSNSDLELLILAGKKALRNAEEKRDEAKRNLETSPPNRGGKDKQVNARINSLKTKIKVANDQVKTAKEALAPYQAEWNRRHPKSP